MELNDGLYDSLISHDVAIELESKSLIGKRDISNDDITAYLTAYVGDVLAKFIQPFQSAGEKIAYVNKVLATFAPEGSLIEDEQLLQKVMAASTGDLLRTAYLPEIPLSELALLTNAKGEPSIGSELPKELFSADRVDVLMAFVRQSGLNRLYESFKKLKDLSIPVRLLTSAYIGATERKALDQLVSELGVDVKVDYLARSNRLHAKAWLMMRNSGFSTAYVGSSNISDPALSTGVEWNVRLSAARSPEILKKFSTAFESYWNSGNFESYDPARDSQKLDEALSRARGTNTGSTSLTLSMLDVQALPHQQQMLTELQVERDYHCRHRNLVVAATGSGKTVLAGLDFRNFLVRKPNARLLFVAHRQEILQQSKSVFAQILKDANFGEYLVGGQRPQSWNHVFASVQSLSEEQLSFFDSRHFDYIVIDEFHHASAPSYRRIMDYFSPEELLGLTATPERTDGVRVQDEFFDGRIATELRLWDALDLELLSPFQYFGIGEETKFTGITWRGARGYDIKELSNLVTGNTIRDRQTLVEINRKIGDLGSMRALAFCVSIEHANHMAQLFNSNGITAASITSESSQAERAEALEKLKGGTLQVLTSVDVFNEGLDVPSINTIVMLRPTESPLIFLQQLGRGLRKSPGKSEVLVLDFIGAHRAEYRLDLKLAVITGRSRGQIVDDLKSGFPYLPSGVGVSLDRLARDKILENIKSQIAPGEKALAVEVTSIGATNLSAYLESSARELWEIYRHQGLSWTGLKAAAGIGAAVKSKKLNSINKFVHVNDPERFEAYKRFVTNDLEPWSQASERERRLRNMFFWHMWPDALDGQGVRWESIDSALEFLREDEQFSMELVEVLNYLDETNRNLVIPTRFRNADIPLNTHANYSRWEIMGATGKAYLEGNTFGYEMVGKSPKSISFAVEGVQYAKEIDLDIFYVTLQKGSQFSASTRYRDFAESESVFHWESQNKTSIESETGKRYLSQQQTKHDVLICIRESAESLVRTQTFKVAGLADFLKHEGSAPISIWWELRVPLDLQSYKAAAAVRVA